MSATPPAESGGSAEDRYHEWKLRRRALHGPFDNQQWYDKLSTLTFPSVFVPLPLEVAEAMIAAYKARFNRHPAPTAEAQSTLVAFEAQLHRQVQAVMARGYFGAFVRLTTRSPKDAAQVDKQVFAAELVRHRQLAEEAKATPLATPPKGRPESALQCSLEEAYEVNAKMCALSAASVPGLRVTSGAEAMELMARSERVFTDLLEAVECREVYDMQVVVRAWDDAVDGEFEFRAFVHRNQLTAISQYNHYVFLPHVAKRRAGLVDLISRYWRREVRDKLLHLRDYVVDFAVLSGMAVPPDPVAVAAAGGEGGADPVAVAAAGGEGGDAMEGGEGGGDNGEATGGGEGARKVEESEGEKPRVMVIELNPFQTTTGACLYSWRHDAAILSHGEAVADPDTAGRGGGQATAGRGGKVEEEPEADASAPDFRCHMHPRLDMKDFVECAMESLELTLPAVATAAASPSPAPAPAPESKTGAPRPARPPTAAPAPTCAIL